MAESLTETPGYRAQRLALAAKQAREALADFDLHQYADSAQTAHMLGRCSAKLRFLLEALDGADPAGEVERLRAENAGLNDLRLRAIDKGDKDRAERDELRARVAELEQQLERVTAVGAQLGSALADRTAELMATERPAAHPPAAAVYLSTPCANCDHTLNWHRNDVGCTVTSCVCGRFQP